jgi:hypothetical protein
MSLILKRKGQPEPGSEPPGLGWFIIFVGYRESEGLIFTFIYFSEYYLLLTFFCIFKTKGKTFTYSEYKIFLL